MNDCSDCGTPLRVDNPTRGTWTAVCPRCYDPADDANERERRMGIGPTPLTAKRAWHERKAEAE